MDFEDVFKIIILCIIVMIIYISDVIYCAVNYGNLPPDEVPSWVHWFMLG